MHLLGISLFLAYLLYSNLASDFSTRDYDEYTEQEPMDEPVSYSEDKLVCLCVKVLTESESWPTGSCFAYVVSWMDFKAQRKQSFMAMEKKAKASSHY
ncbi:hypothetical protein GOODEAATRI_030013 [Goodea atripinnis]|uniref:Secreted protein n=1 Tax=Goodea atripinnis TaxID=208336 RepID=A0ABV0MWB7_9TELE